MISLLSPRAVLVAHMQKLRQKRPLALFRLGGPHGVTLLVYEPTMEPPEPWMLPRPANSDRGRT